MSLNVTTTTLAKGSWIARFSHWFILLESEDGVTWGAAAWRNVPGDIRTCIGSRVGMTLDEAKAWSADVLTRHGAKTFVLGAPTGIGLKDMLAFQPNTTKTVDDII